MARKIVLIEHGCHVCDSIDHVDGADVFDLQTEEGLAMARELVAKGMAIEYVPTCVVDEETGVRQCTIQEYKSTIFFKQKEEQHAVAEVPAESGSH